jgi:hypothetical protein
MISLIVRKLHFTLDFSLKHFIAAAAHEADAMLNGRGL